MQQLIRTAYPGVVERAYPGWSSLRYFTSERFTDRVVYLSPGRDYVNLGFERSRTLPDPRNLLTGKGANMRHIRISIATKFEDDYYLSLLKVAFQQSLARKAEAQVSLKGKSPERRYRVQVSYVIVFVSDMKRAVSFYRDTLGLPLKFEFPGWTEFAREGATLALHASKGSGSDGDDLPPGRCRPGLRVPNVDEFHRQMVAAKVCCIQEPRKCLACESRNTLTQTA